MRNLFSSILPISLLLLTTSVAIPQSPVVITPTCNTTDREDDTVCLQNAFTSLQSGEVLSLQEGTYFYSKQLFVSNKTNVVIQGNNTTLYGTHPKDQALTVQDSTNVRVTGLHINSMSWDRSQSDRSSGILLYRSDGVEIDNNHIEFSAGAGIHVAQSTTNYQLHDNEIHDTFADGIHQTNCSNNGEVYDNLLYATGDDAIASVGYERNACHLSNIDIYDNIIMSTRWGRGVTIEGTLNATVSNNFIARTDAACILVSAQATGTYVHRNNENVTIVNNDMEYCNTDAFNTPTLHGGVYFNADADRPNRNIVFEGNTVFDTVRGSGHVRVNANNINVTIANNQISDQSYPKLPFRINAAADVEMSGNTYNGKATP
jgi:hypothetical protein